MATKHLPHAVDELCPEGLGVYRRSLREGRILRSEAVGAPCLEELGILEPHPDDPERLRPSVPIDPAVLDVRFGADACSGTGDRSVIVLDGLDAINAAIDRAMGRVTEEFLAVQPGGTRPPETLAEVFPRDQALLTRGCRMRTLYQHTTRHSLPVLAYFEQLTGDAEARTLHEVTDRLFVFDRTVAFIPASRDRSVALELRHPALVEYFATTFWRLWGLATPMWPQAAPQPPENGITARQHAIAGLLVEGLTDAEVADRLGMNIRTARVHIAKLASTLGSHSRAQLGYLIGQSKILDHHQR
ncbi:LuxR C-terminal-related transcriptional regulator [Streptomyces sp. NPDC058284]|uniref:helix-turn-helix transcriptional regulator n=1 Tax=unclassified Streptomyces TaxID=2593676 RepID=UPI003668F185